MILLVLFLFHINCILILIIYHDSKAYLNYHYTLKLKFLILLVKFAIIRIVDAILIILFRDVIIILFAPAIIKVFTRS